MEFNYSDLIAKVTDPNLRSFFVFDTNKADADREWIEMLKRGVDVSNKYIYLVFRSTESLWSLHSEIHKGDTVISMIQLQQQISHLEMRDLVIAIVKRVSEEPLFSHDLPSGREKWYWMLFGTTNMAWKYLLDPRVHQPLWRKNEVGVARKYNLWLALSRFREGRLFELPMWCGPYEFIRSRYDEYYQGLVTGNSFRIEDTLAPFSQYLRDLGMKEKKIAKEYLEKMKSVRWDCNPEFFLAIANDPIFSKDEYRTSEYFGVIQDYLQGQLLGHFLQKETKEVIEKLVTLGGPGCKSPCDL